jgi:hypothetical protein
VLAFLSGAVNQRGGGTGMLEAITISRVATYPPEPQHLSGLKATNVVFGTKSADVLSQIESARAKVEELRGQIANLAATLGAADNSSGKRKELADARAAFQEECWSIAAGHREHFRDAFTGALNSKAKAHQLSRCSN